MAASNLPWRSCGVDLRSKSCKTAADALREAHLDWTVSKRQALFAYNAPKKSEPTHGVVPRKYVIVKDGVEEALGVVGSVYTPLQNARAFNYIDPILSESHATFEAAGELKGGRKVWVLVDMHQEAEVIPGDKVKSYLLLVNGFDGLQTVDVGMINLHQKTGATFNQSMSITDKRNFYSFKHTTQVGYRSRRVPDAVKSVHDKFQRFVQAAQLLAGKKVDAPQLEEFLLRVEKIDPSRTSRVTDFKYGVKYEKTMRNIGRVGGGSITFWSALSGVSEYIDFDSKSRGTQADRLTSAWFGAGAITKSRAMRIAIDMAKGPTDMIDYDQEFDEV